MAVPADVEQALDIADADGIPALLRKMRTLEKFYDGHDRYSGFKPFISVYRQVTEDVQALYAADRFNNPATMEELDLYFAKLYLDPMKAFLVNGEKRRPWRTYIDYCRRDDRHPSLAMFLGINAHINGDLLQAVNHVGLDDEADYNRVNGILENHLSDNLHHLLVAERDRLALYAELVKPVTRYELHRTVIRWRADIWAVAGQNAELVEAAFVDGAERMADRLIRIGHEATLLRLPVECVKLRRLSVDNVVDIPDADAAG
jgi:hypothetical protein